MELFPAIDLRAARAVRLRQGDYADETVYGDDPVRIAVGFAEAGARWIHVVDLDAARTGEPTNRPIIGALTRAVRGQAKVQSGGGVRSQAAAEDLWALGVDRVVIGTAAVEDPELVTRLAQRARVAVGLDTRAGEVAVRGWVDGAGLNIRTALERLDPAHFEVLVVTDIGRDAMLQGPDLAGLTEVLDLTAVDVIASGGVSGLSDLNDLARLRGRDGRMLKGVIVGKAIYEGRLTVAEGVATCAASG